MKLPHWLRCKWGKWQDGDANYVKALTGLKWSRDCQIRICEVCGKRRVRLVTA